MFSIIATIENEHEQDKVTEIFEKYYSTMMYIAKSYFNDPSTAEDVVSESMIKIIRNLDKISDAPCHKTRGYIVKVVKTTALNMIHKRTNSREDGYDELDSILDEGSSALDGIISSESYEIILESISMLPEKLSSVLYLSAVMEYSNHEIADMLGMSYDAVRTNLSRARKAIKKKLSERGGVYYGK